MSNSTDYSLKTSWMRIPENPELPADVFFIYPTAYFVAENNQLTCDIDNATMRKRATENVSFKGSAFETVGNYYVPWYRQACLACLLSDDEKTARPFFENSVTDVINAFTYYMENLNNGRPFILAGHSQGSMIARILMSTVFKKHPEYQEKMIAAYILGFSVTEEYMAENPHLTYAEGEADTGVIISYNTEAPGMTCKSVTLEDHSIVINPVNWSRGEDPVPAAFSRGTHIVNRNPDGTLGDILDIPYYASARCDLKRGVVVCDSIPRSSFPVVGAEDLFPEGIFHVGDYSLYYYDLRHNAMVRRDAWFAKHQ